MSLDRRTLLRRLLGGAVGLAGVFAVGTAGGRFLFGDGETVPTVLVAGSLQGVAARIGDAVVEAHGSLAVRRLVVEGARDPDALALADPRLFEGLADEVTLFATNALAISYDPDSRFADALAADWIEAIQRPEIALGRTDPSQDPLGYRTVLALRLAEPLGIDSEAVLSRAAVFPETGLMRTLEAGEIDAAFTYRNMAVEHDVPFVDLPPGIDFSDPSRAEHYRTVELELSDRTVRGAPIVYAAASLTDRGANWTEALTTASGLLREAGFTVPRDYPRTRSVSAME